VLEVAATFASTNWLWGVDLGRYLPRSATFALWAFALAGLVPVAARRVDGGLDRLGSALERGRGPRTSW